MTLEPLIDEARKEYAELGTFATDTYMALTGAGLNPEHLADRFERELEEEETK